MPTVSGTKLLLHTHSGSATLLVPHIPVALQSTTRTEGAERFVARQEPIFCRILLSMTRVDRISSIVPQYVVWSPGRFRLASTCPSLCLTTHEKVCFGWPDKGVHGSIVLSISCARMEILRSRPGGRMNLERPRTCRLRWEFIVAEEVSLASLLSYSVGF